MPPSQVTGVVQKFWLHAMCSCTGLYFKYQIPWENWWFELRD